MFGKRLIADTTGVRQKLREGMDRFFELSGEEQRPLLVAGQSYPFTFDGQLAGMQIHSGDIDRHNLHVAAARLMQFPLHTVGKLPLEFIDVDTNQPVVWTPEHRRVLEYHYSPIERGLMGED